MLRRAWNISLVNRCRGGNTLVFRKGYAEEADEEEPEANSNFNEKYIKYKDLGYWLYSDHSFGRAYKLRKVKVKVSATPEQLEERKKIVEQYMLAKRDENNQYYREMSIKKKLKKEAIEALPEPFRIAALVPDYTPLPLLIPYPTKLPDTWKDLHLTVIPPGLKKTKFK